ncbi:hypothetical protein VTJ83DRAFT_5491 [Remersonia thermophila]|uniref:Uncharacterized protein n=1 Tax=Remersonia thermophila TaxID=72144 RepID=A0ABR4D6Z7_9PEZI
MAVEGATQALVAAFLFGIVLNAASAALVLYFKGYGLATLFRDSQRLVLVFFLVSAALWAQIDFVSLLFDVTASSMPCQITIIFSTVFDQLARFSIEQFLLWAFHNPNGAKLSVAHMAAQALVLARFAAGAVFAGFTRPQTDDFCVATTSALPVGIAVAGLDGAVVLLLLVQARSAGAPRGDRARALMAVLLGLAFWTGTSVPLFLGMASLPFATRTALPAAGLLAAIAPSPRRFNISRDISTSGTDAPPSRYEDLKEAAIRSSTAFVNPREAPRAKDETTVMPASELARRLDKMTAPSQKKHVAGGKFAISNPILQENAEQNPLNKIAVVDLQAAAAAERERRAKMHEEELKAASRPPPRPTVGMAPEEMALQRAVSVKRKEVASVAGSLKPEEPAVAVTTSAKLSPGPEEARRRSPRPVPQEETVQPRQKSPTRSVESASSQQAVPRPNRPLTTTQPLLKTDIRPSRTLPPSPPPAAPEPAKTPLQRRPTIGLPSNPRAKSVKVPDEAGSQHRTVLFLNNIEYDDPLFVETIVKTAGNPVGKRPAPPAEAQAPATAKESQPARSASVLNRPRPIPRKPAHSPADLAHRRSRSGGSIIGRKSVLTSTAGSPTRLPPLPSLPRTAGLPARPHPNDTKSMTFEEKVTLLFPTPPSGNAIKRRSSSVPEVPTIPVSYFEAPSPTDRTTKTSFRTDSMTRVDEIPRTPGKAAADAQPAETKRRSSGVFPVSVRASAWTEAASYRTEDDSMTNWSAMNSPQIAVAAPVLQGLAPAPIQMPPRHMMTKDTKSTQSFVPDTRSMVSLPIMLDTSQDFGEVQPVDVSAVQAPTVQVPVEAKPAEEEEPAAPQPEPAAKPQLATAEMPTWHRRVGDECPTFSDRRENRRSKKMTPPAPLPLHRISTKKVLAIQVEPSPLESPGQAIQMIQAQLRNLDQIGQGSPGSAARRQALLEDLEREMGQQAEHWQEIKHDMARDSMSSVPTASSTAVNSRHASVASTINLLREDPHGRSTGADRQAPFARVRNNATLEVPRVSNRDSASPQLSKWQKRLTEAQMDYMDAKLLLRQSNVNFMQLSRAQLASPTPPESDNSDSEPSPPVPSLPQEEVPVKKTSVVEPQAWLWTAPSHETAAAKGLLWTPPAKQPVQVQVVLPALSVRLPQRKGLPPLAIQSSQLWRKPYNTANTSSTGLWRPRWASAAPPAQRLSRPTPPPPPQQQQQQKPPRPVTQRPPRRSRRMTSLPDILESPEPLPNKRDTLGIFQFPWGEKSDTATIPPPPPPRQSTLYMAMPGTMTTGGPVPVMPLARPAESYSSSFFDEYDDDEVDSDELQMDSEEEGSEGEDDFDETTLWEIASLLKTDAVPSKKSLIGPSVSGAVADDYMDNEPASDEEKEEEEPSQESIVIALAEPRELLLEEGRESAAVETVTVVMEEVAQAKPTAPPVARIGLPANPKASLNRQVTPAAVEEQAPKPVQTKPSAGLWAPAAPTKPAPQGGLFQPGTKRMPSTGSLEEPAAKSMPRTPRPAVEMPLEPLTSSNLWAPANVAPKADKNWILSAQPQRSTGLWTPPQQTAKPAQHGGLFQPGSRRAPTTGSLEEPAAKFMPRSARPAAEKPLEQLTSSNLWAPAHAAPKAEKNWILGATAVKKQGSGLWSPVEQMVVAPAGGLFVPGAVRRADQNRRSDEEPAAKHMARKPRAAEEKPLEGLTSSSLWEGRTAKRNSLNWILGDKAQQKQGSAGLWRPSTRVGKPRPRSGLFVPGTRRPESLRFTSEEPAAKLMARKPRAVEDKPLEQLASSSLWEGRTAKRNSLNWILGGKAQQKQGSAGLWRLSTRVGKPRPRSGLFVPGSRPTGSIEEPAAKYMIRKPRSVEQKPLDKLTSDRLWEAAVAVKTERNWIVGGEAKKQPKTKIIQRHHATPADWKAALDEAVRASYPPTASKKLTRVAATPAQWAAALEEAIALSYPRAPVFDASIKHPVFAASSLITRSEWFHPAATGYTYDVANVHPVFFGSLAITCPEDQVHPAISAYASRKLRRQRSRERRAAAAAAEEKRLSRSRSRSTRGKDVQADGYYVSSASARAIEARIEALEQERLCVERAAKEEYRRRTSTLMMAAAAAPAPAPAPAAVEPTDVMLMPAGMETVQTLQRHLSWQIRQSLVLPKPAEEERPKATRSSSVRKTKAIKLATSPSPYLWTPPAQPAAQPAGLWSSCAASLRTTSAPAVGEDALAAELRVRRRKQCQKHQRRAEILAQIAAVERGMNPFVECERFKEMALWDRRERRREVRREMKRGERGDWPHTVCVR